MIGVPLMLAHGVQLGFAYWTSGVGAAWRSTPRTSAWPAKKDTYCLQCPLLYIRLEPLRDDPARPVRQ